jgi:hypothetical protein
VAVGRHDPLAGLLGRGGAAAPHPRSAVRTATNAELFGGNRETLRQWLSPDHPAWSAAATFRERREYLFDRTARSPHIRTVRVTAQRESEHWYELL